MEHVFIFRLGSVWIVIFGSFTLSINLFIYLLSNFIISYSFVSLAKLGRSASLKKPTLNLRFRVDTHKHACSICKSKQCVHVTHIQHRAGASKPQMALSKFSSKVKATTKGFSISVPD